MLLGFEGRPCSTGYPAFVNLCKTIKDFRLNQPADKHTVVVEPRLPNTRMLSHATQAPSNSRSICYLVLVSCLPSASHQQWLDDLALLLR